MSELTKALDRIMAWMEQNEPELATAFLPGLTREEIDAAVKDLPCQLTEELYELYQWRNGMDKDSDGFDRFITSYFTLYTPIKQAVEFYQDAYFSLESVGAAITEWVDYPDELSAEVLAVLQELDIDISIISPFYPFSYGEGDIWCVLVGESVNSNSPVITLFDQDLSPKLEFPGLTKYMQAMAECLETSALFAGEYGYFDSDRKKVNAIGLKYGNPREIFRSFYGDD